jgi:ABC-type Zn uptake system ZnuABC Zn-binding protein ZnuA
MGNLTAAQRRTPGEPIVNRLPANLFRPLLFLLLVGALPLLGACQAPARTAPVAPAAAEAPGLPRPLAVESFLADIAQNVAGDRLEVATLMPLGLDPHAFEPTPQDVARVGESDILIVNGAGFEEWLQEVLDNAGGKRLVIEASAGLTSREPSPDEAAAHAHAEEAHADEAHADEAHADEAHADHAHEGDPHFWLDPTNAIRYAENIRDGLSQADPEGAAAYAANADAYIAQLRELDAWIETEIAQIPPDRRLLVTNHESLGYFADRYGLRLVGAVVPSVTTGAAPSAQQLAALADLIRATGAPAIFLETGANADLAEQLREETGIAVVTDIYTHSLTAADGPAATYLDMMRYNTETIVAALGGASE